MTNKLYALIILTAGCIPAKGAQPADSLRVDSLREVTVEAVGSVRTIGTREDGSARIFRKGLSDGPSFMGSSDPVAVMRSMPAIATNSDLQASLNVRGSSSGANSYCADGMRITNPLHMLGFYSAFNPEYFESYDFRPGYIPAAEANTSGAVLSAFTRNNVPSRLHAAVSLGLIESHFALETPVISPKVAASIGGRMAYPSKIFPNLLELGSSNLLYGFWDANATLLYAPSDGNILKITMFLDKDNTNVSNRRQGVKEGLFGWSNSAAGISWRNGSNEFRAYWSHYRNRLKMDQGSRSLDLLSGLDQITAAYSRGLSHGLTISADINWRNALGQHNAALPKRNGLPARPAVEMNAAAGWSHAFSHRFRIESGLRLTLYCTKGYTVFAPQPRVMGIYKFAGHGFVSAACQRQVRFDRLIETSAGGLPSDFWTAASPLLHPDDVYSFEISGGGNIPVLGLTARIDIYAKRFLHAADYAGNVMDMLSPSFDANSKIAEGTGWSKGVSLSLMRQFGRLRGRIGYNIGKASLRSEAFGNRIYPTAYDRLHDLNVVLTWQPLKWLNLSASYIFASGLPYTPVKYGYMVGENLICEYFPHNSSRLPDYNRLDLSASCTLSGRHGLKHKITVSVYNALASKNVLFRYVSYSISEGISHRSSVMKMAIPSITYTISLQ